MSVTSTVASSCGRRWRFMIAWQVSRAGTRRGGLVVEAALDPVGVEDEAIAGRELGLEDAQELERGARAEHAGREHRRDAAPVGAQRDVAHAAALQPCWARTRSIIAAAPRVPRSRSCSPSTMGRSPPCDGRARQVAQRHRGRVGRVLAVAERVDHGDERARPVRRRPAPHHGGVAVLRLAVLGHGDELDEGLTGAAPLAR